MSVVQVDVVDVGRDEVEQGRHGVSVPTDGAGEHLSVDGHVVGTVDGYLAVRLPDILPWISGQCVHRRDEPERRVTFLHMVTAFHVDIVLESLDVLLVLFLVAVDTVQDECVGLFPGPQCGGHACEENAHHDCADGWSTVFHCYSSFSFR